MKQKQQYAVALGSGGQKGLAAGVPQRKQAARGRDKGARRPRTLRGQSRPAVGR